MILPLHSLNVLQHDEAEDGPFHMALDEAALHFHPQIALRFYQWRSPQITFGYFGNHDRISAVFPGTRLTRRWTGGGIVEHGTDLTFSLTIPNGFREFQFPGGLLYSAIHSTISELLLRSLPGEAWLAEAGTSDSTTPCFQAPVKSDVVGPGGKIAGGAIRKTKTGILYQGSIRHESQEVLSMLRQQLPEALCPAQNAGEISIGLLARTAELVEKKYGTRDWLRLR